MKNNAPRPTKRERARITIILSLTCIYCTLDGDFRKRPLECHHIVRGNKRLGHWYTLQVCAGHHRGEYTDQPIRVGIHSGRHALKEAYGYDELELWQRQQVALNLDDELPVSKIVPRREYGNVHPLRPTPRPGSKSVLESPHEHAVPSGTRGLVASGIGMDGAQQPQGDIDRGMLAGENQ